MKRSGFTMIEVLISLLIAGICVSIAYGVFATSLGAVEAMLVRAHEASLDATGRAWLEETVLAAGSVGSRGYVNGSADTLRLAASSWVPAGWVEPTEVTVAFVRGRLTMMTKTGTRALSDSLAFGAFDYLGEYGADSPWLRRWDSATNGPLAVRLRRTWPDGRADTTVLYVGRGR